MVSIVQPPVYALKITLLETNPAVTRVVKVRSGITLDILHEIIQCVMGWDGGHLHQFIVGKTFYADDFVINDDDDMGRMRREGDFTLRELAPKKGSSLKYEYDFGDSWMHLIKVQAVISDEPDFTGAVCLAGENACPPEDCGGAYGYESLREILADRKHPEHKEMKEWAGPGFDPTAFHLNKVNAALKRLKF